MASRAEAELALILSARNLASDAVDDLSGSIKKVGDEGETSGGRLGRLGKILNSIPFGGIARELIDLAMHSKPVRDMMEKIGKVIGEKLAPVMAKITAWVDDHLIPALTKLADFIGPILATAIDKAAWAFEHVIGPAIEVVIGVFTTLITKIQDAIDWLGQFNKVPQGNFNPLSGLAPAAGPWSGNPGHAGGGWVGLNGPEIALLGERGPEYVVPNNRLGGGSSEFELVPVRRSDLARMVDEALYFRLRRAAPTSGRV